MSAARRALPTDLVDLARSFVPVGLLALAAALPPLRVVVLIVLALGAAVAIARDAPVRWTRAGAVPVAVSLFWGTLLVQHPATDLTDCANLASPVAAWRAVEAIVVLVTITILGLVLHATPGSLWLHLPARAWWRWALLGFVVAGPLALVVGPYLAAPFFGDVSYVLVIGAFVPALIFAVSNGVMEEIAYRGALLGWSGRVMGTGPALVGQAIVFGLAHSGTDVVGFQIPLSLAMALGGLLAGVITLRTRSLLIPIAVHIGLDLPIYFAFACPAPR
jgi:membrane protease YdiL (CAAX protease family)